LFPFFGARTATGLKDQDPKFQDIIKGMLSFMIGQEFDTYDQAIQWWNANRDK
jgi:hypothetical protein